MENNLQESECLEGWLHRYVIVEEYPDGVVEICKLCKKRLFFHNKIPNEIYLAHHLRQTLQFDDLRFNREYKTI